MVIDGPYILLLCGLNNGAQEGKSRLNFVWQLLAGKRLFPRRQLVETILLVQFSLPPDIELSLLLEIDVVLYALLSSFRGEYKELTILYVYVDYPLWILC